MAARLPRLARPLTHLRPATPPPTPRLVIRAASSSSTSTTFRPKPAPPRLPPSEQAEFERLQRAVYENNTTTSTSATSEDKSNTEATATQTTPTNNSTSNTSNASNEVVETPPQQPLRRGAPPEFEGDVNPRTGEVGGPKNEPLRWGAGGDYSFNGRVTDF